MEAAQNRISRCAPEAWGLGGSIKHIYLGRKPNMQGSSKSTIFFVSKDLTVSVELVIQDKFGSRLMFHKICIA